MRLSYQFCLDWQFSSKTSVAEHSFLKQKYSVSKFSLYYYQIVRKPLDKKLDWKKFRLVRKKLYEEKICQNFSIEFITNRVEKMLKCE